MLFCRLGNLFGRDVLSEVDNLVAVVFKQQFYDVFADVVDVALDGGDHHHVALVGSLSGGGQEIDKRIRLLSERTDAEPARQRGDVHQYSAFTHSLILLLG